MSAGSAGHALSQTARPSSISHGDLFVPKQLRWAPDLALVRRSPALMVRRRPGFRPLIVTQLDTHFGTQPTCKTLRGFDGKSADCTIVALFREPVLTIHGLMASASRMEFPQVDLVERLVVLC